MSSGIPPWLRKQEHGLKRPASPPDLEWEPTPKRLADPATNYAHRNHNSAYTWIASSQARVPPVRSGDTCSTANTTDYVKPIIIDNSERPSSDQHYIPTMPIPMPVDPINYQINQPQIAHQYYGNPTPNQINGPLIRCQPNPYVRINIYNDGNCPNVGIPSFPMQPPADLILDVFNGPLSVNDIILKEFNLTIDKIVEEIKTANKSYAYKLHNGDVPVTPVLRWKIRERIYQVMQNKPVLSKYNVYNCYRSAYHIDSDSELFLKECGADLPYSYSQPPQTKHCEIFDGPKSVSVPVSTTIELAVDQIVMETIKHIKSVKTVKKKEQKKFKPFVRDRLHKMLMGKPVPSPTTLVDAYKALYNTKGYDHELRNEVFRYNLSKSNPHVNDLRTGTERDSVFNGAHTAGEGTLIFLANTALSIVDEIPGKTSKFEMMGLKWSVLGRLYNLITGSVVPSGLKLRQTYKRVHNSYHEYKLVGYIRTTTFRRSAPAMDLFKLEEAIAKLQSSIESTDSAKIEELADSLLNDLSKMQYEIVKFHTYTLELVVRYRIYTLFKEKALPLNLYEEYRKYYDIQSDRNLLSDVLRGKTNWISSQNEKLARPVQIQQDTRTQTHEKESEMQKNTLGVNTRTSSAENISQISVSLSANNDCGQTLSITDTIGTSDICIVDNQFTCIVPEDINKTDLLRIHSAADQIINNLKTNNLNDHQRRQFKFAVRGRFYGIVRGKEVPNYKELISAYRKSYNERNDNILLAYILNPKQSNYETEISTLNVNACASAGEISQHSVTMMLNDMSTTSSKTTNLHCQGNEQSFNAPLISIEETKTNCQEFGENSSKSLTSNDIIHIDCEENEQNSDDSVISNEKSNIKCENNEQYSCNLVIPKEGMNLKCEENEQNSSGSVISNEKLDIKCEKNEQKSSGSVILNEKLNIKSENNDQNSSGAVILNEKLNIKCENNEQNSSGSVIPHEKVDIKYEEHEQNSSCSVITNEKSNRKYEENEQNSSSEITNEKTNRKYEENEQNSSCSEITNEKTNRKYEENEQNSSCSEITNAKTNIKCEENEHNYICSVIQNDIIYIDCEEIEQNSSCSVIPNETMNMNCEENEQNSSGSVIQNDIIYIDCEEIEPNSSSSLTPKETMNMKCGENEQNFIGSVIPKDIICIDCEENEQNSSGSVKTNENKNTDSEETQHIFRDPVSASKTVLLCINVALNKIIDQMKLDRLKVQHYQRAQIQLLIHERIFKMCQGKKVLNSEELVCAYRAIYNVKSDHETVEQIKANSIFSGPEYTSTSILNRIKSLAKRIISEMKLDFTRMPSTYEQVELVVQHRLYGICMGTKVPRTCKLYIRYQKQYKAANDIKLMFNVADIILPTNEELVNEGPTNEEPVNERPTNKEQVNEGPTNREPENIDLVNTETVQIKTKQHPIFSGLEKANHRTLSVIKRASVAIVKSMNEACRNMSDLDLQYLKFMIRERIYKVAMGISLQSLANTITLYRQQHNVESDSQLIHDISIRTHSRKFSNTYQKLHELSFGSSISAETHEKVKSAENLIFEEISLHQNCQFHFYDVFIKWIVRYRIYTIIKRNPKILQFNVYNVYRQMFNKQTDYFMFKEINFFEVSKVSKGHCDKLLSGSAWPKILNKHFEAETAFQIIKSVQDQITHKVSELMSKVLDKMLNPCSCTRDNLDEATSSASGTPTDDGIFAKTVRRLLHHHLDEFKDDLTSVIATDDQLYSSLGLLPPYNPHVIPDTRQIMLTGNPQLPTLDQVQKYLKTKCNPRSLHVYRDMKNVMFVDIANNKTRDKLLMNPFDIDGHQVTAKLVPRLFTEYTPMKRIVPIKELCTTDIEMNDYNNINEKEKRRSERYAENDMELTTDLQDFDKSLNELDDQSKPSNSNVTDQGCIENNMELTTNLQDFDKSLTELDDQSKPSNSNITDQGCIENDMELTTDLQDFHKSLNELDDPSKPSNSNVTDQGCIENNMELTTDLQDFHKSLNELDDQSKPSNSNVTDKGCIENNMELTTDLQDFDKSLNELDDQSKPSNSNVTDQGCIENNMELTTDLQDFDKSLNKLGDHSKCSNSNLTKQNNLEPTTDLQDFEKIMNKLDHQLNDLFMSINHSEIIRSPTSRGLKIKHKANKNKSNIIEGWKMLTKVRRRKKRTSQQSNNISNASTVPINRALM